MPSHSSFPESSHTALAHSCFLYLSRFSLTSNFLHFHSCFKLKKSSNIHINTEHNMTNILAPTSLIKERLAFCLICLSFLPVLISCCGGGVPQFSSGLGNCGEWPTGVSIPCKRPAPTDHGLLKRLLSSFPCSAQYSQHSE